MQSLSPRSLRALSELEAQFLSEISIESMLSNTARLAQWERLSGTPQETAAADYVRETLQAYGVTTRIHAADIFVSLPRQAALILPGANEEEFEAYTHSFARSTPAEGLDGDLTYVGRGRTPADYRERGARGRIVLIDGIATPAAVALAEDQGSIGQIFINTEDLYFMIVSKVWGAPTPETASHLPHTPSISIRKSAGDHLKRLLQQGHTRVRLRAEVWTGWSTAQMVEGEVMGAREPEHYLLFGGHLDSWAYGAMDNGAANAVMLELARLASRHRQKLVRSVRFVFWSGHSHGRYAGSTWYADQFWHELYDRCVAYMNLDSPGAQGATSYDGAKATAELEAVALGSIEAVTGQRYARRRMGRGGDQSFWGIGIPALFGTLSRVPPTAGPKHAAMAAAGGLEGMPWWWHTIHDTVDKLDPTVLQRDAAICSLALLRLCAADILPLDYTRTIRELRSTLETLDQAAQGQFDFEPLAHALDQLLAQAVLLNSAAPGHRPEAQRQRVNQCFMKLGRLLIPLGYTACGPFDQDLALQAPLLPSLQPAARLPALPEDSDDRRFLITRLIRERNRALHTLKQARETIASCLEALC
jgi:hypothetical protein